MTQHYADRLAGAITVKGTPALVGLDPRFDSLPEPIRLRAIDGGGSECEIRARGFEEFCLRIIDVVSPLVPAVKPQVAFFEECGPAGMSALWRVIRAARERGLIVIADAKRGDIGSTAEGYARAWLAGADIDAAPWGADALTVNAYMGVDTLEPFITQANARGAGIYVLARTSNPGSAHFQSRMTEGESLYSAVARAVQQCASESLGECGYGAVGAVVGATYPAELAELRAAMPSVPLLVPGYGSQGGTSADVAAAFRADGQGAVINSSRGIIFAHSRAGYKERFAPEHWEQAVEAATLDMIADLRTHATPLDKEAD
ncbi:MAG: orotidine-5'-phosphate decarboxylase [Planctomycetaceae bacterium]